MKDELENEKQTEEESSSTFGNTNTQSGGFESNNTYSNFHVNTSYVPQQEDPEFQKSGTVSMVLGIIALVLGNCCCVNIVLAIISFAYAKKNKRLSPDGRMSSTAVAGTICSWISIAITVLMCLVFVLMFIILMLTETGTENIIV